MDSLDTSSISAYTTMSTFMPNSSSLNEPENTFSEMLENVTSFPNPPSLPINFTFKNILPSGLYIPDDIDKSDLDSLLTQVTTPLFTNLLNSTNCVENLTWCLKANDTGEVTFSPEDLWAENNDFARTLIPAMVFIAILMVLGIAGNLLVVYIFGFRFKSATQHFLIVCLACFDLLMSCIAMPSEIADMRFHHTFSSLFACKLLRFITMFSSISSSFTLVTIAIDRHKRVTKPLAKQMTVKRAKIWELVNIIAALFFSWPLLVLTGLRTSETRRQGLYGTDCSFSDRFHNTKYPLVYNAVLGTGFLVLITVIGFLYFRIWKIAKGHRVYMANKSRVSVSVTSIMEPKQNARIDATVNPVLRKTKSKRGNSVNLSKEEMQLRSSRDTDDFGGVKIERHSGDNTELNLVATKANGEKTISNEEKAPQSAVGKTFNDTDKRKTPSPELVYRHNGNNISSLKRLTTAAPGTKSGSSRKGLPDMISSTRSKRKASGSISWKNNASPTMSLCSSNSSPILRIRSLKAEKSLSSSMRSNQSIRPLSSLMDSVSQCLWEKGTMSSYSQPDLVNMYDLTDTEDANDSMFSSSKQSAISTSLNTLSSIQSNGCQTSPPARQASFIKMLDIRGVSGSDKDCDNYTSKQESITRCAVNVSEASESQARHEDNYHDMTICSDTSKDFRNLITSSSTETEKSYDNTKSESPIEVNESVKNRLKVDCAVKSSTHDKNATVHYIRRQSEIIVDGLETKDKHISTASTSNKNDKRRSTVVSILERYRIRSGSTATLDNTTLTSVKSKNIQSKKMDKTTVVAFAVSSVFVLSFLPYLALMFVRAFVKDFDYNLDDVTLCLYNIFLRFYLLNSAANPLLYGLLNERFRRECKRLLFCRSNGKTDKP